MSETSMARTQNGQGASATRTEHRRDIPATRTEHRRDRAHRRDTLWLAALVHRLSGLLLVCFLPLHFLALGLAIESEARLDSFLKWTDQPLVKLAEMALVFLFVVHIAGGIRVLLIEALGWSPIQKQAATAAIGIAAVLAIVFYVRLP